MLSLYLVGQVRICSDRYNLQSIRLLNRPQFSAVTSQLSYNSNLICQYHEKHQCCQISRLMGGRYYNLFMVRYYEKDIRLLSSYSGNLISINARLDIQNNINFTRYDVLNRDGEYIPPYLQFCFKIVKHALVTTVWTFPFVSTPDRIMDSRKNTMVKKMRK